MGGGSSTLNTSNVRTKAVVEALARNIMNCKSDTVAGQRLEITGNNIELDEFRQVQNLRLSSNCIQDVNNLADIQQSVANAVKQAAESQSVSVLGALGRSDAEVRSNIENEVKQTITQENIQNIINNVNAQQTAIISGSGLKLGTITQEQTFNIIYENSQKLINNMRSVQVIENSTEQATKSTQTNFVSDIVDSFFKGLQGLGWVWVAVIGIIAMVLLFGPTKAVLAMFVGDSDECVEYDEDRNCVGKRGPLADRIADRAMAQQRQYVEEYAQQFKSSDVSPYVATTQPEEYTKVPTLDEPSYAPKLPPFINLKKYHFVDQNNGEPPFLELDEYDIV